MIFKYKAYINLLIELGRNDYVVEIASLAAKDFFYNMSSAPDPAAFLKEKCEKYGIQVSYDPKNNYDNQITLSHIANVYHLTEAFLYEMQTEYNDIQGEKKFIFSQGTTKLDQVIKFFKAEGRFNDTDRIHQHLVDTFEYYHQLRTYFAHKKTTSHEENQKKWRKATDSLNKELLSKYKVNSPPKELKDIDFEDYFLFTQIAKNLALQISSFCHPDAEMLAKQTGFKKLKRYIDNKDKVLNAIRQQLSTQYGWQKENDSDILDEQIFRFL